jgi:hypothetical protein
LVKNFETSSPRVAISAISSAVGEGLDLFGIGFLLLFGCFPGGYQTIKLSLAVFPDLEDDRA